jgi:ABC-type branched-subunit amino acid transport system ATPase component
VIQVESVDFSYGRLQVLFGVSLQVEAGETLALLGTNGAGKSTLLRLISGLDRPSAGRITFNGRDVTRRPAEQAVRDGLVLVPGGKAVFPDLTVKENLDIQAVTLKTGKGAAIDRVLTVFPGLGERLSQRAGSLSGGQQQQLAIAKALILRPAVLCIDELSLGLAPIVVEQLLQTVQEFKEAGTTLILVEQSLNVAAHLCQRAVFMEKGEIRFEGPTAQLLERDDIARAVFLGGAV